MRFPFFLAILPILSLAACASSRQAQVAAPRHLRVASYNIHCGGCGMDGTYDLHRIARVLAQQKPDVVFLQEVDMHVGRSGNQDTAAVIAKDLGMRRIFGKAIPLGKGEYGVAVLSAWPMKKIDQLAFTGKRVYEPRTALFIESEIPADATHAARPVLLVGTHLDFQPKAADEVAGHAAQIVARIRREGKLAIFGGDLNFEPGSKVLKPFLENLGHADKTPYPDPFAPGKFTVKTCPADKPTQEIDHLFWYPASAAKSCAYSVVPQAVASDHRPVVMELELAE